MSDLAELEAKAKALVGTQHWRGLDPEAVLEALDAIKRLCEENAQLTTSRDFGFYAANHYRAALETIIDRHVHEPRCNALYEDENCITFIARQALKEIDE